MPTVRRKRCPPPGSLQIRPCPTCIAYLLKLGKSVSRTRTKNSGLGIYRTADGLAGVQVLNFDLPPALSFSFRRARALSKLTKVHLAWLEKPRRVLTKLPKVAKQCFRQF
jgi:hypothetical protein